MNDVIQASGLTKAYPVGKGKPPVSAVGGIDFAVRQGEVFGFLGPNGAGKTTTIRMLTGLTRPTAGGARVLSYDLRRDVTNIKKRIGVVPEASNLYDELSAVDNLVFSMQLYGVPRRERLTRAVALLARFRLSEKRDTPFAKLSRGMKRALTIAAALAHRPPLIFLDEPTTGLDVQSAIILREQVRRLNREGTTVLLTTHYLEEADQLCDIVAMINKGKIVALDSPEQLKASVIGSNIVDVSFSEPVDEDELRKSCGLIEIHRLGDKLRLTAADEVDVVAELADYARSRGLRITSISTLKPSLEDAFLRITGLNPEEAVRDKEPARMRRQDG